MGRRHLSRSEAVAALNRGAGVAQFLGFTDPVEGRATFRVVSALADGVVVRVYLGHFFEPEDPGFFDVGAMEEVDADNYSPEDGPTADDPNLHSFEDAGSALEWVETALSGRPDLWVNESMIGDEYADAQAARS